MDMCWPSCRKAVARTRAPIVVGTKEQASDDAGEPALGIAEDGPERLQHAGQRQRTVMSALSPFSRGMTIQVASASTKPRP